jgi:hypothetical protein
LQRYTAAGNPCGVRGLPAVPVEYGIMQPLLLTVTVSHDIPLTLLCAVKLVASLVVAAFAHVSCWSSSRIAGHHEFVLHSHACSQNSEHVGIADLTQPTADVVSVIVQPADGMAMVPDL